MRQAIVTRYYGVTNTKQSRIKAWASAGYVWMNYDQGVGQDQNHTNAAHKLARKFGWAGHYAGGGMPDGCGNVYVWTEGDRNAPNNVTTFNFTIARDPVTGEAMPEDEQ